MYEAGPGLSMLAENRLYQLPDLSLMIPYDFDCMEAIFGSYSIPKTTVFFNSYR